MTREEAIDFLKRMKWQADYVEMGDEKGDEVLDMAIEALEQRERKKGMWKHQTESLGAYEAEFAVCSVCKDYFDLSEGYSIEDVREFFAYCPHCGAKMEGE